MRKNDYHTNLMYGKNDYYVIFIRVLWKRMKTIFPIVGIYEKHFVSTRAKVFVFIPADKNLANQCTDDYAIKESA